MSIETDEEILARIIPKPVLADITAGKGLPLGKDCKPIIIYTDGIEELAHYLGRMLTEGAVAADFTPAEGDKYTSIKIDTSLFLGKKEYLRFRQAGDPEYIDPAHTAVLLTAVISAAKSSAVDAGCEKADKKKSVDIPFFILVRDPEVMIKKEGYVLYIHDNCALIIGREPNGIFYGIQTLRQLMPPEIEIGAVIGPNTPEGAELHGLPPVLVADSPMFGWRGFMFDVSRHFFPVEVILKMLDLMALHKMNRFHWHLVNDQGWRLEIKRYPKLTEIGSIRKATQIGGYLSKKKDNTPHGGYYSHEDVRKVLEYARKRFITVVPEIEMPGHCMSALAAYPEMSCTGGPFEVQTTFGIKKDIYCAGKEKVFEFIFGILDEVCELFDGPYIHIGGDEVPKDRWKKCPDCRRRIREEHLKNAEDLHVYFVNRVADYLISKGKIPIGWSEILHDNLRKEVIVQYWLHKEKEMLKHLRSGRKFIMSHFYHVYLDYNYGLIPLKKTYMYDYYPKGLEPQYRENILGLETPIWTEWVADTRRLFWQVFPRFTAVAEIAWIPPDKRDYADFKNRLEKFYNRLKMMNIKPASLSEVDPGKVSRAWQILHLFSDPLKNNKD